MSGVLQRLVGRATGEAIGSLRPRLPSRFEGGIHDTRLREYYADVPVSRASEPPFEPVAREKGPAPQPATIPADPPPEPVQPLSQSVHSASEPAITPGSKVAPQPRGTLRSASPPDTTPAAAPKPLLPEATPTQVVPPVRPHVDPPPPDEMAAPEPTVTPQAAPAPLLPPDQRPRIAEALNAAPPHRQSARAADAQPAPPAAPEQEIVIHIGRLDIRSVASKPARAPRAVDRPGLPALSDYLRGGRS